jgi:hypothetical protein
MTIMMMGEGTFTMQDWDDIVDELKKYCWPEDQKRGMRGFLIPTSD